MDPYEKSAPSAPPPYGWSGEQNAPINQPQPYHVDHLQQGGANQPLLHPAPGYHQGYQACPQYPPQYTQYPPQVTGYQPVPQHPPAPLPRPSVVIVGGCPACRVGVLEDDFTCLGVCCAIFFFPIGILCCLAMRQRRCPNCRASFS